MFLLLSGIARAVCFKTTEQPTMLRCRVPTPTNDRANSTTDLLRPLKLGRARQGRMAGPMSDVAVQDGAQNVLSRERHGIATLERATAAAAPATTVGAGVGHAERLRANRLRLARARRMRMGNRAVAEGRVVLRSSVDHTGAGAGRCR
jgi:hypothetical protein